MTQPLAIDLFCGLGGFTEGLLAEGFRVVGFDIERHVYGEQKYPAQLVIQDVLTIHGSQFKDAALIVASPPCHEFSYMAMPWSKAKQIEREYLDGTRDRKKLTALFDVCFRIQREASEAAGHHIPMVVENVRGAQKWVGRSRWNFGSFHLWGDVPALMPMTKAHVKVPGIDFNDFKNGKGTSPAFNDVRLREGIKGGELLSPGKLFSERSAENPLSHRSTNKGNGVRFTSQDCGIEGVKQRGDSSAGIKQHGSGREWFAGEGTISRVTSSRSNARKHASAMIAKIPEALSRHIARVYKP